MTFIIVSTHEIVFSDLNIIFNELYIIIIVI